MTLPTNLVEPHSFLSDAELISTVQLLEHL
jgi:hypothetical protein